MIKYTTQKLKPATLLFWLPALFISVYLLCNMRLYFFDDEFFTLGVVGTGWSDFLDALKEIDVHPPLSYILFKLWFAVFGKNIYASQILSLSFMALGLAAYLYVFGKLFPEIRWFFALIAIHPLLILWGGAARYYTLLFLLFNLGIIFFVKIFRKDYSVTNLFLYIFISLLGLYTEFMYFLALIPQLVLIALSIFFIKDSATRFSYRLKYYIIVSTIAILYLPWLPQTFLLIVQNVERFGRPSAILNLAYIIYGSFLGQSIMPYDLIIVAPSVITFGFLFIYGIVKMSRARKDRFLIWLGLSLGAVIVAIPIRLLTVRHFLFLPGLLLIPVLYSISSFSKKWIRSAFLAVVLIIYLYGNVNIALKRDIHKAGMGDPVLQMVQEIEKKAANNKELKVIVYSNVLDYALKENKNIASQIIYFNPLDFELSLKLSNLFYNIRPHTLVYVWSYYGAQPDYEFLDKLIQRFLDEEYGKVSEIKFARDERMNKISRLIHKSYLNPRGYRFLIQEYKLKETGK